MRLNVLIHMLLFVNAAPGCLIYVVLMPLAYYFRSLVQGQNQSGSGSGGGGADGDKKDKKKKYEPPVPTRVGKKKKRIKGPDTANKLPQGK